MFRAAFVLAAVIGAAVWAVGGEVEEAGACTGGPGYELLVRTPIVLEGWIQSLEPIGPTDGTFTPYAMTVAAVRGYRGVEDGAIVVATVRVPDQGIPVMCPQVRLEMVGQYILTGIAHGDGETLIGDAWSIIYQSDEAPSDGDVAYSDAVRMAELATDSNPEAPLLTVDPDVVTCGDSVRYRGERFEPGEYRLGFHDRGIAIVNVGPSGTFDVTQDRVWRSCLAHMAQTYSMVVDVRRPGEGPHSINGLVEFASLDVEVTRTGQVDSPQLVIPPDSTRCGEEFTISGTGFEPNEPLTLMVSASGDLTPTTANADGFFQARVRMPDALCGLDLGEVRAFQRGFEAYGHFLASTHFTPLEAPGPPDVGNSVMRDGKDNLAWPVVTGLLMGAAGLGAGAWLARSRRTRP